MLAHLGASTYSRAIAAKPASATIASPARSDMATPVNVGEEAVALVTVLVMLAVAVELVAEVMFCDTSLTVAAVVVALDWDAAAVESDEVTGWLPDDSLAT